MLRGITIDLSGTQLSDLFFNFEHPARDRLYTGKTDELDPVALRAAIVSDAMEFLAVLNIPQDDREQFAEELADDFQHRV